MEAGDRIFLLAELDLAPGHDAGGAAAGVAIVGLLKNLGFSLDSGCW